LAILAAVLGGCKLPLIWATETPVLPATPPISASEIHPTAPETGPGTSLPATPSPEFSPTPAPSLPPASPTPTSLPYVLQPGAPAAGINFAHPDLGCDWFGVAGQVLDALGNPVDGLLVEVRGTIQGAEVRGLALTGAAPAYGPAGYEITLGDRPVSSSDVLEVQLFNISGEIGSGSYRFSTYEDCQKNLILINFVEIPHSPFNLYLPSAFE
jgi:hypothetical protein